MQPLFGNDAEESQPARPTTPAAKWSTRVLGFIGSSVIFWVALKALTPIIVNSWGVTWIGNQWARIGVAIVLAVPVAALLSRIEGTIWGKYYVIIGYLLSLVLIVWIVLHLLHYI